MEVETTAPRRAAGGPPANRNRRPRSPPRLVAPWAGTSVVPRLGLLAWGAAEGRVEPEFVGRQVRPARGTPGAVRCYWPRTDVLCGPDSGR